MKKALAVLAFLAVVAAGVFYGLTAPNRLSAEEIDALPTGDALKGETVFWAGGCASCHSAPGAKGDAKLVLSGGHELKTPFGIFRSPNISPHADAGIGNWSPADFANAMLKGTSPNGSHYYPAFPYTSYARMTPGDVVDLFAYILTLPKSDQVAADHSLGFPFNIRRGLGLWKRVFLSPDPVVDLATSDAQVLRGQYLVEGPGHCGACHTPRNLAGGAVLSNWLGGGPAPEGDGRIPNITPHESGIGSWSAAEIAESLKTGFTPSFDSFGSSMVAVQENMARLTEADRAAIAAYLKAIKPVASAK